LIRHPGSAGSLAAPTAATPEFIERDRNMAGEALAQAGTRLRIATRSGNLPARPIRARTPIKGTIGTSPKATSRSVCKGLAYEAFPEGTLQVPPQPVWEIPHLPRRTSVRTNQPPVICSARFRRRSNPQMAQGRIPPSNRAFVVHTTKRRYCKRTLPDGRGHNCDSRRFEVDI